MIHVTPPGSIGTRLAPDGSRMNFRCGYCHRDFAFEAVSYPYLRSQILLHLAACKNAVELSRDERAVEASKIADRAFFYPDVARP